MQTVKTCGFAAECYTLAGRDHLNPLVFVVEGDPNNPDGRRVVSNPASGGQSSSTVDANGGFNLQQDASLGVGTPGEPHVLKTLIEALGTLGNTV